MVFNNSFVQTGLIVVDIVWLVVLTVFVVRMLRRYSRLVAGVSKIGLTDILDAMLRSQHIVKKQVGALEEVVGKLQADATLHIQRVGIVRFNPFSDTGGRQSFTLSLLDGHDNGIVMTSLYARTGNRWYIKKVREGKGVDMELSKEEEAAISSARPLAQLPQV